MSVEDNIPFSEKVKQRIEIIEIHEEYEDQMGLEMELEEFPILDKVSNINFELPPIIHNILLFSYAHDVVILSRVSRRFREVATSDLLWKSIIENHSDYFPSDNILTENVFFYDLKREKENLFRRVVRKFHRGYERTLRLEKRANQRYIEKKANKVLWHFRMINILTSLGCLTATCPPLATIFFGIIGYLQYYNDERNGYGAMFPSTVICDTCFASFCSCCGFHTCCASVLCCFSCCCGTGWYWLPGVCWGTCLTITMPCYCFCDCCGLVVNFIGTCCGGCCGLSCLPCCLYGCYIVYCCGCITSPLATFLWGVVWLGRFYYLDEMGYYNDNVVLLTSPTALIGIAVALYIELIIHM